MSLIQGCLSRTATTAADMDAARTEHQPAADSIHQLRADADEATRDVLTSAAVIVDWADRGNPVEPRHFDGLRDAVHRRDAAIAALREARTS